MNFLFLNQWALWFLPALAIPVIIHLIFKRQHRVVDWAAIQFLIEAEKRVRRKLKLIELILLLLRCLVIAALVLLFSRLLLKDEINLIPGQNQGNDHLFIIDNSPSLDLKINGLSYFKQMKKKLLSFIDHLAVEPGDHRVTVMSWVDGKAVVKEKNIKDDLEGVKKSIEAMSLLDAPVDYLKGLTAIDRYKFKNTNSYKVVYYISDFQNSFVQDSNTDSVIASFESQAKIFNESHCFLLPFPNALNNLSLESVKLSASLVVQNVPVQLSIKVRNNGTKLCHNVAVNLVAENKLPITETIDQLGPNQEATIEFSYTFKEVGLHRIKIVLPDDDNEKDNYYYQSVNVKTGSKVLIVVSESSIRENETEGYFISNSLNPPGKQYGGNNCEIKSDTEFSSLLLNDYNVIYLCNVFQVNAKMQEQLDIWVKEGGKLIIALGDQIDVGLYNDHFFKTMGLGVQINDAVYAGDEKYAKIAVKNSQNSCLSFFKNDNSNFLDGVQFYQWYRVSFDDMQKQQVVATYQFEEENPCIVRFEKEEGSITLFTSTLDNKWNNWPSEFSYVILNLELVRQGLKNPFEGLSVIAGNFANMKVASQYYENKSAIVMNDLDDKIELVAETGNNNMHSFKSSQLLKSGFFDLALKSYDGVELKLGGDINLHPNEGQRNQFEIDKSKLKDNYKIKFHDLAWFDEDGGLDKKNEVWKIIVILLFALMCMESLFAWFAGRSR